MIPFKKMHSYYYYSFNGYSYDERCELIENGYILHHRKGEFVYEQRL